MTTVAIIQARMTSTRLPGKVLLPLGKGSIIDAVITRVEAATGIDHVCVAIPEGAVHAPIAEAIAGRPRVSVVRGPEHDVLQRYLLAAERTAASVIVRVTSDCPLIDPAVIAAVTAARREARVPYASTALETGYPTGYDVEAITREALEAAGQEAADPYEREHVTPFIWRRPERFAALYVDRRPDLRSLRLVVDTAEDYEFARKAWAQLGSDPLFGLDDILNLYDRDPGLFAINQNVQQKPYVGLDRA